MLILNNETNIGVGMQKYQLMFIYYKKFNLLNNLKYIRIFKYIRR